jgi:xanthine dehydrogenase accessory factor
MLLQAAEEALLAHLATLDEPAPQGAARAPGATHVVRVLVVATQGSVPRDKGTWMAVIPTGGTTPNGHSVAPTLLGTIGGGRLEFDAIAHAQALLDGTTTDTERRYPLGPSLGQCCGGVVDLRFELHSASTAEALRQTFAREHSRHPPVALFGGGHVGQAIARALAPLPVQLQWIDSREGVFPNAQGLGLDAWPSHISTDHSEPVQDAVRSLTPQSSVLIMSFSHAEDLDIVIHCLQRQRAKGDLPFIGLIGSKTKWATFRHRLEARGFSATEIAHITCPIGLPTIQGKEPSVIAASVVAQLLGTFR